MPCGGATTLGTAGASESGSPVRCGAPAAGLVFDALDASGPDAGSVRLSWLARVRQHAFTRRLARYAGDAAAACGAVLAALWAWSARDGVPLSGQYVLDRVGWFVLAGAWLVLLQAVSASRAAFSPRDTASVVARALVAGIGPTWSCTSWPRATCSPGWWS